MYPDGQGTKRQGKHAHGKQACQRSLGSGNKPPNYTNYNSTSRAGPSYNFRNEKPILHLYAVLSGESGVVFRHNIKTVL